MNEVVRRIKRALPHSYAKRLPRTIVLVRVDMRHAAALNFRYRRKRAPANVLSFRYGAQYGEILISPEVIRREARRAGNSYRYQVTWMVLHGMLHLAGVHHETSAHLARRMGRLEERILRKMRP